MVDTSLHGLLAVGQSYLVFVQVENAAGVDRFAHMLNYTIKICDTINGEEIHV
jgi:hypothetical protein